MKIYRITKQQLLGCTLDRFVEQCSHILLSIPKKLIFKKILSAIILLDYKKSFFHDKTQKLKKNHQFTANFPERFGTVFMLKNYLHVSKALIFEMGPPKMI